MRAERGLAGVEPALPPEGGEPLVALRGVRKAFGSGTVALERLNLDVRDGEFLSLLGPSGCGKSTVLRLIAGLTSKTDGSIDWRGGQPSLGFVFQEPTLAPWSDVFTNVWLPLRLRGMSRAEATARIEEALARVGLTAFAKAYPRELSGGMKMRVSLARALVMRPALLLLDEPFAALDEITRSRLNDDLLQLKSALGATIVFVTHSVYESVYLSTRITVMAARPGRIVADIPVDPSLPRNEDFRLGAYYAERCRETSAALELAMRGADALGSRREIDVGRQTFEDYVFPIVVFLVAIGAWEAVVRIFDLPPYVLPAPSAVAHSLYQDWGILSRSLLVTLTTTFEALIAAIVGGVLLALSFRLWRPLERAFFPFAVVLQVTPIIAIAPLLLVYLSSGAAVLVCAFLVAFFPILSNTALGLASADHNLVDLFVLYGASPWQQLALLRVPSALPYFLGGLRIGGGLALIGAIVAEIAAGSAGSGSGLAFRIVESGFRLNIPRMFAALLLISVTGICIFLFFTGVSYLLLHRWHDSARGRER